MILNYANLALITAVLLVLGLLGAIAIDEYRHPCLKYVTRRVHVPEMTTYLEIEGGSANVEGGGFSMPQITPEHDEDEVTCVERRK